MSEQTETLATFDPSSTCIGYALGSSRDPIEFGRITPDRSRDPAITRIEAMRRDLRTWLADHLPGRIRIEVPSGKVHGRKQGVNMAGLTLYGVAVGMVLCEAWAHMESRGLGRDAVETVAENVWTRGVRKQSRQAWVAQCVPSYDPAKDKGGDASDAIGLLQDWFAIEAAQKRRDAL